MPSETVNVFPISTSAFGLRADWFENISVKLIHPAYVLMTLLLVISVGIMVLKRFENADLEKKAWNIPVIITIVMFWPLLVLGLKSLVDTFDTFLVRDVFQIPWRGFGFPSIGSVSNIFGWSAEGVARLLPNLAYWIIYAFYTIFFFFFAVLGPLLLAKGILFDEIEGFLGLVGELANLFLWQTTVVILVAFIMPDIVSGKPFPVHAQANFYFLSLILGILMFFTPAITRKFSGHLGRSTFSSGFKWGGAMVGLTALGRAASLGRTAAGLPPSSLSGHRWTALKERLFVADEFRERSTHKSHIQDLEAEIKTMESRTPVEPHKKDDRAVGPQEDPRARQNTSRFIHLSKRAKDELNQNPEEDQT